MIRSISASVICAAGPGGPGGPGFPSNPSFPSAPSFPGKGTPRMGPGIGLTGIRLIGGVTRPVEPCCHVLHGGVTLWRTRIRGPLGPPKPASSTQPIRVPQIVLVISSPST